MSLKVSIFVHIAWYFVWILLFTTLELIGVKSYPLYAFLGGVMGISLMCIVYYEDRRGRAQVNIAQHAEPAMSKPTAGESA